MDVTPGHAGFPYGKYRLAAEFPIEIRAEVSVIAPANGFPGGGWQIRFARVANGVSEFLNVADAFEYGVLLP